MEKTICELFAGVGGFRLGFDRLETGWKTTWFSQWEASNIHICSICKKRFIGTGYDSRPITHHGVCCGSCYTEHVFPAAIEDLLNEW